MELRADVGVSGPGADAVFSQIEDAFREFGIKARAHRVQPMAMGTTSVELPLTVAVAVLLVPFFNAVVSKAGDDAYAALKNLVRRAITVEEKRVPAEAAGALSGSGAVAFQDAEMPVGFTVDLGLPDVAFRRLTEIDWAQVVQMRPTWQGSVTLRWHPRDEEWRIAFFNMRAPLAGAIIDVDERNFEAAVIHAGLPVLVHFWADWAGPCRVVASYLEELAKEREDLRIARLNVDESPDLTGLFGVLSIPTLLLFRHGRVAHAMVGARSKSEVVQQIESVLAA
jgi:thioredoxin 1